MYHRLAAVWGRYAVGALVLGIAWSGAITLVDSGESSPWRTAYAVALDALFVINVLMVVIAIRYYVRSRKYGDYGDESPSWWAEQAESENQEARQISAENVNEKASKLGGTWESELAQALNRQMSERTH
jgi:hypothetical protein